MSEVHGKSSAKQGIRDQPQLKTLSQNRKRKVRERFTIDDGIYSKVSHCFVVTVACLSVCFTACFHLLLNDIPEYGYTKLYFSFII